jgi:hypothetical protein
MMMIMATSMLLQAGRAGVVAWAWGVWAVALWALALGGSIAARSSSSSSSSSGKKAGDGEDADTDTDNSDGTLSGGESDDTLSGVKGNGETGPKAVTVELSERPRPEVSLVSQ